MICVTVPVAQFVNAFWKMRTMLDRILLEVEWAFHDSEEPEQNMLVVLR